MKNIIDITIITREKASVVIVPDIDKVRSEEVLIPGHLVRDIKKYCMFCAKEFWRFSSNMEQVICDPIKNDFIEAKEHTFVDRCINCKDKNKKKTFDGRVISDPKTLTIAESDFERPRLWKNQKTRI